MAKQEFFAIDVVDADGNVVYQSGEVFKDRAELAGAAVHYREDLGLRSDLKMKRVDLDKKQAGARQLLSMPIGGVC